MKKIYLFLILLWVSWQNCLANEVPVANALQVARNFLAQAAPASLTGRNLGNLTLVHQELSKEKGNIHRVQPFYYVFEARDTGGIVFVAADDKVSPILGYTPTGHYDPAKMPVNLIKWLEGYKKEIRYAAKRAVANPQVKQAWKALQEGQPLNTRTGFTLAESVDPLVTTTWNQSPFYNALCPYDNNANERAVSGCVATAMAQIMRYWKYPAQGSGFHSYNHEKYGTLSANFSNTTYNWDDMPNNVTRANSAVATLMQHIGVSVNMNYGVATSGGSGAYVISSASPLQNCSEYALKTYFGYTFAEGVERNDYTLSNWVTLLKKELDAGRPILYAGYGGGGGHAFVCDGYDSNDMFHMNWGWGGAFDGYFAISALSPADVGTGGGTGSYNSNQQAVINIKAPTAPEQKTVDLQLFDDVTLSTPAITFGEGFTVHTDIVNRGTGTFTGDYGAAAFDENGNFAQFIQTYTNNTLEAGFHYTDGLDFTADGTDPLLPGVYDIYIYYRVTNGQWEQLKGSAFGERVTLEVINRNDLSLLSALTVQKPDELYQGKKISITTSVKNKGTAAFTGKLDVSLYTLEGKFVYTIEEKTLNQLCANCSSDQLTFQNDDLDVEPGTYLLALQHLKPNGTKWELTGAADPLANPIEVVVQIPPLAGDEYEDNNTVSKAFHLPLNFSNKRAQVTTPRANIHEGSDYDLYKITLPAGRKYELTVRVHDSYSSEDDNTTYTNDVLFSLSDDGENWTDAYDDEMEEVVEVAGGTTVYAFVAPFFQGETGTYLLDIQVKEGAITGIEDERPQLVTLASPNPTSGTLRLNSPQEYTRYELTSLTGSVLMNIPKCTQQVNISHLNGGLYLLRGYSKQGWQVQKILKQ